MYVYICTGMTVALYRHIYDAYVMSNQCATAGRPEQLRYSSLRIPPRAQFFILDEESGGIC